MRPSGDLAIEHRDGWIVAHLSGEVDMANASRIGDELSGSITNAAAGLIVAMERTTFIDSAAIGVLFRLARRLRNRRQRLRLVVPPSSPLRRVLEITEVHTVATVHETLDQALTAVS